MEALVELWQQAKTDRPRMDMVYKTEDVIPHIIKLEKKQQKLLRFKTLSSVLLLLALLIVFLNRMTITIYSGAGIGIFIASVLSIVGLLNRLRFRITYEERSLTTLELAEVAARKIKAERKIFSAYLPLFFLVALTGFNLLYLDTFRELDSGTRILYHLVMTGTIAVAFVAGLLVRIKRFQKQFLPLLARIQKLRSEFN